jgi:hypothetical protein
MLEILIGVVIAGIYVVPGILAQSRGHPRAISISVLNLFAGWTIIGWMGALVWALLPKRVAESGLPELAPMHQCHQCGRMQLADQYPCLSCGRSPFND